MNIYTKIEPLVSIANRCGHLVASELPCPPTARASAPLYLSVIFAAISQTCLTERYSIHFEGQRGHQRGCYRYPQGASDFRPHQNGQVHTLSIINMPPGFTFQCNEPWTPRHMCISYYCFRSAHRSLWHLTFRILYYLYILQYILYILSVMFFLFFLLSFPLYTFTVAVTIVLLKIIIIIAQQCDILINFWNR